MKEPIKILFQFPCRGRVDSFFESLDSLNDNIRDRENYLISLVIDNDDKILNTTEVINRINKYPNVAIKWGISESKINAINRQLPDYSWELIILWSNDMIATCFGFDDIMRGDCLQVLELNDYDMLLHWPEPDTMDVLNVLYVATRKFYSRFGYIYHPSYKSLFSDNETMAVAKMLNRYHFFGTPGLYVHKNPAYHSHGMPKDDLFIHQQSLWGIDEANYYERAKIKFGLKDEEIKVKKVIAGGREHNFE